MQHFDNDMDDLFRRAAEKFPLKKADSAWEKIAGQVGAARVVLPVTSKKPVRKRYLLLVLLFLFIGSGSAIWLVGEKRATSMERGSARADDELVPTANSPAWPNSSAIRSEKALDKQVQGAFLDYSVGGDRRISDQSRTLSLTSNTYDLPGAYGGNDFQDSDATAPFHTSTRSLADKLTGWPLAIRQDLGEKMDLPALDLNQANQNLHPSREARFYLGVMTGPDFSRVKSQSVKNTGFNLGIVAGYRLGRRWSLEAGLQWESKKYYTVGEHFKMDKIGSSMPAGMKIMEVNSRTQILQIPVNLKFDFGSQSSTHFFALAGVSSYLVLNERNNYHVELNGNADNMKGAYQKNAFYSPGAINLGAGYEWSLRKNTKLRIQPYLEIPLKGVGVGSLPVTSSGLQIGFTRSF